MIQNKTDIEKINAFSKKELKEDEVYTFTLTLCDNDIDRDFESFSPAALEQLKTLFVGKTGIFDHSMKSSDQKARIFDTYIETPQGEKTKSGEQLYRLKARAYMLKNEENKTLIDEIEGGIKKEVSVSCSMGSSVCSVCGKDRKKERCSHIGGKSYNGKLCYTVLDNALDAYEFSFVAVPAQRSAGVTKSFKAKEDEILENIIEKVHSGCEIAGLSSAQVKQLGAYIDSLEEDAELGKQYKKELSQQVLRLFAMKLPEIDSKLFGSVVSVMTVNELLGFKEGLEKSDKTAEVQLASAADKAARDYSQFRI